MNLLHIFRKKPSGRLAKDRLKILLISDRLSCSPDIAKVISKYMKIDAKSMEIQIMKEDGGRLPKSPVLYANIPILDMKHY